MKKNHGLILKILRFYEEKGDGNPVLSFPEIQGFTEQEVAYHIDLCVGDGLLKPHDGGKGVLFITSLTLKGHDFLVRNPAPRSI